ncbi:MAG: hypothetical protein ACE5J7_00420, partial [Candidatus Aenigmatarchaeota archaeon]
KVLPLWKKIGKASYEQYGRDQKIIVEVLGALVRPHLEAKTMDNINFIEYRNRGEYKVAYNRDRRLLRRVESYLNTFKDKLKDKKLKQQRGEILGLIHNFRSKELKGEYKKKIKEEVESDIRKGEYKKKIETEMKKTIREGYQKKINILTKRRKEVSKVYRKKIDTKIGELKEKMRREYVTETEEKDIRKGIENKLKKEIYKNKEEDIRKNIGEKIVEKLKEYYTDNAKIYNIAETLVKEEHEKRGEEIKNLKAAVTEKEERVDERYRNWLVRFYRPLPVRVEKQPVPPELKEAYRRKEIVATIMAFRGSDAALFETNQNNYEIRKDEHFDIAKKHHKQQLLKAIKERDMEKARKLVEGEHYREHKKGLKKK